jgi:hypothetical protein
VLICTVILMANVQCLSLELFSADGEVILCMCTVCVCTVIAN